MKLSIFTTTTYPDERGDNFEDAMLCYSQLADEVIVVDGDVINAPHLEPTTNDDKHFYIKWPWPQEFNWPFIGQQMTRGYEACTGDWVLKCDIDYIFHENDFKRIREAIERYNHEPALSMHKYQFILPDRYNVKSRLVNLVNKGKYGDRIKFDSGGDLCQVSLDGKYLSPDSVPESKVPFYNYEKLLKTKEQITDDVGRMERAFRSHYGRTQYRSDGTDENAYKKWYEAQRGKFNKPQEKIKLSEHPKYMQDTIKNLKPEQFGYNGFGLIKGRVYG